jgi:tRNA (guanine-N1)-methyltransferase
VSEPLEFEVLTIFPQMIEAFVSAGLMGRAIERELVSVRCTDLRAFTHDRHRSVDDAPFGGGAGMVIKPEPVAEALDAVIAERGPMHTILLTPSGVRFDQRVAERLAGERRIALLCGRYEGIDDRIREQFVDECLSIGDFVLNGGEVAAAVVIEAVSRLREGVLGNPDSLTSESFGISNGELADATEGASRRPEPGGTTSGAWQPGLVVEYPHYTRPASFRGRSVPPVLLSGDHVAIERWRRRAACLRAWALRPELRPRWRLPAGHPICLAVPTDPADSPTPGDSDPNLVLATLANLFEGPLEGLVIAGVGHARLPGAALSMRDLKQVVRAFGKQHGRAPWVLGVGDSEPGHQRGPRLILDVLAFEAGQHPAPLILWLGGPEHPALRKRPPEAWLALDPEPQQPHLSLPERDIASGRLALASALIDIAQPQAARRSVVPLARAALQAMRDEGLLGS